MATVLAPPPSPTSNVVFSRLAAGILVARHLGCFFPRARPFERGRADDPLLVLGRYSRAGVQSAGPPGHVVLKPTHLVHDAGGVDTMASVISWGVRTLTQN